MSGGEIVVVKRGGGDGSRYSLESGAATLGRGVSCDIRVLLSTVSEEQCVVTIHKNQALIRNLSDNNLTLVNGKPVQVKALEDGDVITMGDRSLRWEYFNKDRNNKTNVAKMPAGKIKFSKKKQTATAVPSGRRSEMSAKRMDPQVKKILDLKNRASLNDIHGSCRQIAVVKPQRRSAEPPVAEVEAPGSPSRRARPATQEDNRPSSECKPRLVTKPHRGKSNSPGAKATRRSLKTVKTPAATKSDTSSAKSTPRASQRTDNVSTPMLAQKTSKLTPKISKSIQKTKNLTPAKNTTPRVKKETPIAKATPKLAGGATPKKATPKVTNAKGIGKVLTPKLAAPCLVKNLNPRHTPKKGRTPSVGKKSTPQHPKVEKIDDPVALDANKKVALLLLTGRSPVKKNLPPSEAKTPEKAVSSEQTPAKVGSSKKNTPKFIIKRQSPIKGATPKKTGTAKPAKNATPKRTTPKRTKTPKSATKKATATPNISISEDVIAAPKTPKAKSTPKTPKSRATPVSVYKAVPNKPEGVLVVKTPMKNPPNAVTPKDDTAFTSQLIDTPLKDVSSSRKRKSKKDSSTGKKTVTPKSENVSLADKSNVKESTPNISARKSLRDSSGGRKTVTPKSKNVSLADESNVEESTPNVSARKSLRDSSGGRKTVTPKSKNVSLADESNVEKSTPNVSARKSPRDSSVGRKTVTPKSKNVSLADESYVEESTPNVSARKSLRDSSGGRKTVTPKSKNVSLADESNVEESTPNVSARKSLRDSSGGRKTVTPKSKNVSLADESNVEKSTPNVSARKSMRDSGDALETVVRITKSSAVNTRTSGLPQTPMLDKSPLPTGRKSALKSPINSVRKNESIKFDLSNLERSQDNDTPISERKRKSNNMTADSDIDLKLRFSDITEPSPKTSLAGDSNRSRSSNILSKTRNDSQISPESMPNVSRKSIIGSPNVSPRKHSSRSAMIVVKALLSNETRSVQKSRSSVKNITGNIGDSDLDETAESEESRDATGYESKNMSRTRNSTIFLDSTDDRSEIDTPKNYSSIRKWGAAFTPGGYSIVDLISDQSSNNETLEKRTPGSRGPKTPKSTSKIDKRSTLPLELTRTDPSNLKGSESLISNKFLQSVTSTPLKKYDLPNASLVDNITPVAITDVTSKGPRFSVRSVRKTASPKKSSPKSTKKSLPLSKSLSVITNTESQNVHRRSASTGSPSVTASRKSLNKGSPAQLSVSRKTNRVSGVAPQFLYEDISEASNSRRSKSLGTPTNVSVDKVIENMRKSMNTSQKSPSTPENKIPLDEATTPVLSVADLLNASKGSSKRVSIRNKINHFESMSTPRTPVATQKVTRKTLGAIGDRINRRKSELESLTDKRKTQTDPRKVTRGITKRSQKNTSLNISIVRKHISTRVNRNNDVSSSEQESVSSDTTDVNAPKPENDIVITPKSTIKLVPEILKDKHSTAKKPFSRKSIIDHLNESQEMVKELFRSPVKRKLSQSMVQYSAMQDSDDEFNESADDINNSSTSVKPRNKRLSALSKRTPNQTPNVTFDFDSVKTPHVPTDMFVSPLDDSGDGRRSARNSLYDFVGVKKLFSRNTPKNDLTNVRSLRTLMRTPGVIKSPKNDLTQVPTVKTLFATSKKKAKSPRNDLTKVQGVKNIFVSPRQQKYPKNDLTNVAGIKKMLKTPRQQKSPQNDLTKIPNVRNLFLSPGRGRKSPRNDLGNVSGLTKIFRNPRSPKNALEELSGVEDLFNSSSSTLKEGETSDSLFDKLLGKTPPKHTYQKSKSFIKDKEQPSTIRANKSMIPYEIIENHVEDWLEEELERRTRRDSEISNNDEEVNISQLRESASSKSSKRTPRTVILESNIPKPGSSRKSKVDRALSQLVIDTVDGEVDITPNRRARRLLTVEKTNYSLEVFKAAPSKINKSITKISLPLKKRSISNDKCRPSSAKVKTAQNRSRSQTTLNVSQSPKSRPNSRLSVHSEAEMSLPLKKRTILKDDGALGHSTPVKKKLSPKKVQDSSIVDLGPVSPISKSLRETPQQTEITVNETTETLNGTESVKDSTATTRRRGRRAPAKNTSSAKIRPATRTLRNNTANLSKSNTPKPSSPRLVLEKKGTPKFSPKPLRGEKKTLETNADTLTHTSESEVINMDKSPEKKQKLNRQNNVTEEINDESNSVSTQGKVISPKNTRRGRQGKVESSQEAEDIPADLSKNVTVTDTPATPKGKAGRGRAVKNVASVDSPKPKSTRGRGKKVDIVQNVTIDRHEEVIEVKKPVRGRGKSKNTTVETNDAPEISDSESLKLTSPTVPEVQNVQETSKQPPKRTRKAASKVVGENNESVSVEDSPKPVAKRGRKPAAKVIEGIREDVSTQDSPKQVTKRVRRAAATKVVGEISSTDNISVQESPKLVPKRERKAGITKVVEEIQEESTNKEEMTVPESPKPAPKRGRKAVQKSVEDNQEVSANKEDTPKRTGRRKRVMEEKEAVTEEVKPSPPKKGRGRGRVVKSSTEADVSNAESVKPKGGRRKKEEPISVTKKVSFAVDESAADESTVNAKPAPKGRPASKKTADKPAAESAETKPVPKAAAKRGRRAAEETTNADCQGEVGDETTKPTRANKSNKPVSPKKSPVAVRSTRATRQKK